jgi:lipopolysaccharide/colanic/teichoic acid biosynthesis glycosyltransferase
MKDAQRASRPKIVLVVTSAMSTIFFQGQLHFLAGHGWDVEMVSGPGPGPDWTPPAEPCEAVKYLALPMKREIAPLHDLVALFRLWRIFRRTHPELVVAGTPKAGLLGSVAARLAAVPHVVYVVHGLRMETARGWKRRLLWSTEWCACHCAHHVRCLSPSLRERVLTLGLATAERCLVVKAGSSNGVEMNRWRRTARAVETGRSRREALGVPPEALVIGFVGRLTRDKGIGELHAAFTRLKARRGPLFLLLVGDFESGDPVPAGLRQQLESDPAVIRTGFVREVEPYYWMMDLLALPTYREGMPGVPLEAQAASIPVVTTDATGAIDSIVDGVTGLRVPVGDVDALETALERLLTDPELRIRMGQAGCAWVESNFRREVVWQNILHDYASIVHNRRQRGSASLERILKAVLDRCGAALLLLLSAPLCLGAALAVRVSMGAPVLFRQERPGLNGRPFALVKFRTMRETRGSDGALLPDGERLTWLGHLLRSTSIDELPQLWNVLCGEMSLVGPRPLLMKYLPHYSPAQARRHEVKPGLTGWAQVSGRNALSWEERFALDTWYVDHWSLGLDLRILWLTVATILGGKGIRQEGHATMSEFTGSEFMGGVKAGEDYE